MALSSARLENQLQQGTAFHGHGTLSVNERHGATSLAEILIAFAACGALACAGAFAGFFLVCAFACEGPLLIAGSAFGAVGGLFAGVAVFRPLRIGVPE
jgi:hypothetical protein